MKILVDAYGGDNAPEEIIKGAVAALNEDKNVTVALVGKEDGIKEELAKYSYDNARVEIIPANDVITCEEEPTLAVRKKADSSIVVGFKKLKEDENISAFISGGSTGAYLVGATLILGRIKGVNRPALCPVLPTLSGNNVLLLDAGANADCKVENLVQFALMGSAYSEKVLGIKNPRIALLSNGTEDKKGNIFSQEVFSSLKETSGINFIGNMEARDILFDVADVVVCDGFTGNIALKSMEGGVKCLLKVLKNDVFSTVSGKIGGLFMKKKLMKVKDRMDYNNMGGAVFLGVNKPVIKIHGSSKSEAVKAAILQTEKVVESDVVDKITEAFSVKAEQAL